MKPVQIVCDVVVAGALLTFGAVGAPLYACVAAPGIRAVATLVAGPAGWHVPDVALVCSGEYQTPWLELTTSVPATSAGPPRLRSRSAASTSRVSRRGRLSSSRW